MFTQYRNNKVFKKKHYLIRQDNTGHIFDKIIVFNYSTTAGVGGEINCKLEVRHLKKIINKKINFLKWDQSAITCF